MLSWVVKLSACRLLHAANNGLNGPFSALSLPCSATPFVVVLSRPPIQAVMSITLVPLGRLSATLLPGFRTKVVDTVSWDGFRVRFCGRLMCQQVYFPGQEGRQRQASVDVNRAFKVTRINK